MKEVKNEKNIPQTNLFLTDIDYLFIAVNSL